MSLELVLLRHAPAAVRDPARWPDDTRRPLTAAGRKDARRVAAGLQRIVVSPERIASSPATRCLGTARLVAEGLADGSRGPEVEPWEELAFAGSAAGVVARLRRERLRRGPVLLVGHEPLLGRLVGLLVFGEDVPAVRLRRAGACSIELPRAPIPGSGRLDWLLTRAQLSRLSGPGAKP